MTLNFKKTYSVTCQEQCCFLHAGWDALPLDAVPETCWLVAPSLSPPPPGGVVWDSAWPRNGQGGMGLAQAMHPPHTLHTQPMDRGGVGLEPCTLHRRPSTCSLRIGGCVGRTQAGTLTHTLPHAPSHAAMDRGWHGVRPGHAPSTNGPPPQPTDRGGVGLAQAMHPPHTPSTAAHGHGWHGAHPGHAPSTCTLYMQPTGQEWLGLAQATYPHDRKGVTQARWGPGHTLPHTARHAARDNDDTVQQCEIWTPSQILPLKTGQVSLL